MALFDFLFEKETREITQYEEPKFENDIGGELLKGLLGGEQIDRNKALAIPAVASAVDKISNSVAMLPVKLYQRILDNDGKKKTIEIENDVRTRLLNIDTGDSLDTFQLKKALVEDYLLGKGAFIFIEKYRNDFKSIRYVEENRVSYIKNTGAIYKDAKYLVDGNTYETYEFLSILRNTKDGFSSESLVKEINKVLETSFTTLVFELGLVKKGGGKSGFLQSSRKLDDKAITKLKEAWREYYSNSGENVVVLNEGIEFKDGANSSVELQLNERKQSLNEDIKDVFHLSDNYATYIKDAVMPIINAIESALNKNFLLENEKGSFYFKFSLHELERGDAKTRYEIYKLAKETGFITKNEMRYQEDYEAIDGLDVIPFGLGDVFFDVNTKKYFTPNTGVTTDLEKVDNEGGDKNENSI